MDADLFFDDEKLWVVSNHDHVVSQWWETTPDASAEVLVGLVRKAWADFRSEVAYDDLDERAIRRSRLPLVNAFGDMQFVRSVEAIRTLGNRWVDPHVAVWASEHRGLGRERGEKFELPYDVGDEELGAALVAAIAATT